MSSADRPEELADDLRLMEAMQAGDSAALEALYHRHAAAVLAIAMRVLGERDEAEAATSDVFVQVWRRAAQFDSTRATPLSYLLTIARSRAIDLYRARQRRRRLIVAGTESHQVRELPRAGDAGQNAFEHLAAAERRVRVQRALRQLSSAQREAMELSFFEGLSHREIAERLDQPLGTVKTRIRQGILRLRDLLHAMSAEGTSS